MPTSEVRRFPEEPGDQTSDLLSSMQWFETANRDEFLMISNDSREQAALLWGKRPSLSAKYSEAQSHADIYVERRGRGVNNVPLRQLLQNTYEENNTFVSNFENGRIITHFDGRPNEIWAWKTEHAYEYVQSGGIGVDNKPLGKQLKDTYQDGNTFFTDFENGRIASHTDGSLEVLGKDQLPSWMIPKNVWVNPLPGYSVSSGYDWRFNPGTGKYEFHYGIDIGAGNQNPSIAAASGGTVVLARYETEKLSTFQYCLGGGVNNGYGNLVKIQHDNGTQTLYAHLNTISVVNGQKVTPGDVIGTVGSTGCSTGNHLHIEVRVSPYRFQTDNRDPRKYIPF